LVKITNVTFPQEILRAILLNLNLFHQGFVVNYSVVPNGFEWYHLIPFILSIGDFNFGQLSQVSSLCNEQKLHLHTKLIQNKMNI